MSRPSVQAVLAQSLQSCIHEFERLAIPCVGLPLLRHNQDQGQRENEMFSALRTMQGHLQTLTGAEEHTRDALKSWHSLLSSFQGIHGPATTSLAHSHPQQAQEAAPHPFRVSRGLEAAAALLFELHYASKNDPLLAEEMPAPEPSLCNMQFEQGNLSEHLDACAASVRNQLESSPERSGTGGAPPSPSDTGSGQSPSSPQGERHQRLFSGIQALMFRQLRLKHEPIEWVYDGLSPLLLQEVLHRRKGAPIALALIAASLCTRLGVPAAITRATPKSAMIDGPQAPSLPTDIPHDIAVRHANRGAVSGVPTDAWLVMGLLDTPKPTTTEGSSSTTSSASISAGGINVGSPLCWRPSGVFLDVSCRGGAVLNSEQAQERYGKDLDALENSTMPWAKGYTWQPEVALPAGCAELARAMMVAHQRRGDSDLVIHWLYQLLALDPLAPEWKQMLPAS